MAPIETEEPEGRRDVPQIGFVSMGFSAAVSIHGDADDIFCGAVLVSLN